IYRILEEYGGRAETTGDMGISKDNLGLLLQDTQWIEREQQQKELALIQRESERTQLSRETLHRWSGERAEAPALSRENREYAVQLELIHKSNRQVLEEEQIQELLQQNRSITHREITGEHVLKEKTINVQEIQNHQLLQRRNTEDISEIIDRGIKNQIGNLSDQIYHRLEKRLLNEKRRRGL
ncbi:MAG: hypothetical protein IJC59_04810, partial [Lachnospiraceae bacterium]|nr:hypothetical protein [Lachnospiraceae bacterium]